MSQPEIDLWGDLDTQAPDENPVLDLLTTQATVLGRKTDGRVIGEVRQGDQDRLPIEWHFDLVAPMANHFRYQLFRVRQLALDFPVEIIQPTSERPKTWHCADIREFQDALAQVLRSAVTRKAIASLLALDRLIGQRTEAIDFQDVHGRPHHGRLVIEPLARTADGASRIVTVAVADDDIFKAHFDISGTAEATQDADVIIDRIKHVLRELIAAGYHTVTGELPRIILTTRNAELVDHEGRRELDEGRPSK